MSAAEVLADLRQRLAEKVPVLQDMALDARQNGGSLAERSRLRGKAEGVDLAVSYVDEAIRDLAARSALKEQTPNATD